MAKGVLFPVPWGYQLRHSSGTGPGVGYQVRVYDENTTNLHTLWSDAALTSSITNPTPAADAAGFIAPFYIDDGNYDVALLDDVAGVVDTVDDVRVRVLHIYAQWQVTNKPAAGDTLHWRAPFPCTVLEDFDGSDIWIETVPTGAFSASIQKNGVEVNTLDVTAATQDGAPGGTNSETALATGDRFTAVLPNPADATAAGIIMAIKMRID